MKGIKDLKKSFGGFLRTLPLVGEHLRRSDERELREIFKSAGVKFEDVENLPPLPDDLPTAKDLRLRKMQAAGIYKATEKKVAQVRELIAQRPGITIGEVSEITGVSAWTLSNKWRVKYDLHFARSKPPGTIKK